MSEELELLQKLGAQKIYEDTHIPLQQIQAILQKNFHEFHKVQLAGFFSILEREYNIKLILLRKEAAEEFEQRDTVEDKGIFVTPEMPKSSNKMLYIGIVALLFIATLLYNTMPTSTVDKAVSTLDDSVIETVSKNIEPKNISATDENTTQEHNQTEIEEINATFVENESPLEEETLIAEKVVESSFKVLSKSKVWVGYIDTKANKRYQKTFKGELILDPEKSWLFVFGHPYVNFYVDGENISFKSKQNKRFFYNNGVVRSITAKEFKRLNRGRRW